jgi:hypothetical protein
MPVRSLLHEVILNKCLDQILVAAVNLEAIEAIAGFFDRTKAMNIQLYEFSILQHVAEESAREESKIAFTEAFRSSESIVFVILSNSGQELVF